MVLLYIDRNDDFDKLRNFAEYAFNNNVIPVFPLSISNVERATLDLLDHCNEIWITGDHLTDDMKLILEEANMSHIRVCAKSVNQSLVEDLLDYYKCDLKNGYTSDQISNFQAAIEEGIPFNIVIREGIESDAGNWEERFNELMDELNQYDYSFLDSDELEM